MQISLGGIVFAFGLLAVSSAFAAPMTGARLLATQSFGGSNMTKIAMTFLTCLVAMMVVAAPITASAQTKHAPDPATKHLAYLCKSRNIDACNRLCAGGKYWACKVGNNIHTF